MKSKYRNTIGLLIVAFLIAVLLFNGSVYAAECSGESKQLQEQAGDLFKKKEWSQAKDLYEKVYKNSGTCESHSEFAQTRIIDCDMRLGTFTDTDYKILLDHSDSEYEYVSSYSLYLIAAWYDYQRDYEPLLEATKSSIAKDTYYIVEFNRNKDRFGNILSSSFSKLFSEEIDLSKTDLRGTVNSYREAKERVGNGEKKYLLLDFYALSRPDSKKTEGLLNSSQIQGIIEKNFILVKIDVGNRDKNLSFYLRYNINTIPTFIVVNSKGIVLDKKTDTDIDTKGDGLDSEEFIQYLSSF